MAAECINVARVTEITSKDCGWWRTVTANRARLLEFLRWEVDPEELDAGRPYPLDPASQISDLRRAIGRRPKSARWRLRAPLGDRVPWYMEAEEITH